MTWLGGDVPLQRLGGTLGALKGLAGLIEHKQRDGQCGALEAHYAAFRSPG